MTPALFLLKLAFTIMLLCFGLVVQQCEAAPELPDSEE